MDRLEQQQRQQQPHRKRGRSKQYSSNMDMDIDVSMELNVDADSNDEHQHHEPNMAMDRDMTNANIPNIHGRDKASAVTFMDTHSHAHPAHPPHPSPSRSPSASPTVLSVTGFSPPQSKTRRRGNDHESTILMANTSTRPTASATNTNTNATAIAIAITPTHHHTPKTKTPSSSSSPPPSSSSYDHEGRIKSPPRDVMGSRGSSSSSSSPPPPPPFTVCAGRTRSASKAIAAAKAMSEGTITKSTSNTTSTTSTSGTGDGSGGTRKAPSDSPSSPPPSTTNTTTPSSTTTNTSTTATTAATTTTTTNTTRTRTKPTASTYSSSTSSTSSKRILFSPSKQTDIKRSRSWMSNNNNQSVSSEQRKRTSTHSSARSVVRVSSGSGSGSGGHHLSPPTRHHRHHHRHPSSSSTIHSPPTRQEERHTRITTHTTNTNTTTQQQQQQQQQHSRRKVPREVNRSLDEVSRSRSSEEETVGTISSSKSSTTSRGSTIRKIDESVFASSTSPSSSSPSSVKGGGGGDGGGTSSGSTGRSSGANTIKLDDLPPLPPTESVTPQRTIETRDLVVRGGGGGDNDHHVTSTTTSSTPQSNTGASSTAALNAEIDAVADLDDHDLGFTFGPSPPRRPISNREKNQRSRGSSHRDDDDDPRNVSMKEDDEVVPSPPPPHREMSYTNTEGHSPIKNEDDDRGSRDRGSTGSTRKYSEESRPGPLSSPPSHMLRHTTQQQHQQQYSDPSPSQHNYYQQYPPYHPHPHHPPHQQYPTFLPGYHPHPPPPPPHYHQRSYHPHRPTPSPQQPGGGSGGIGGYPPQHMADHSTAFVDSLSSNVSSPYRYPPPPRSQQSSSNNDDVVDSSFDISSVRSPPSAGRSSQLPTFSSSSSSSSSRRSRRTNDPQDITAASGSTSAKRKGLGYHSRNKQDKVLKHLHSPASTSRYKKPQSSSSSSHNILQSGGSSGSNKSNNTESSSTSNNNSSSKSQKLLLRSPPIKKRPVEEIWDDEHALNTPAATPSRKSARKSASRDGRKGGGEGSRKRGGRRGGGVDEKNDVDDIMETNELMMASPGVFRESCFRSPVVGNRQYSNLPLSDIKRSPLFPDTATPNIYNYTPSFGIDTPGIASFGSPSFEIGDSAHFPVSGIDRTNTGSDNGLVEGSPLRGKFHLGTSLSAEAAEATGLGGEVSSDENTGMKQESPSKQDETHGGPYGSPLSLGVGDLSPFPQRLQSPPPRSSANQQGHHSNMPPGSHGRARRSGGYPQRTQNESLRGFEHSPGTSPIPLRDQNNNSVIPLPSFPPTKMTPDSHRYRPHGKSSHSAGRMPKPSSVHGDNALTRKAQNFTEDIDPYHTPYYQHGKFSGMKPSGPKIEDQEQMNVRPSSSNHLRPDLQTPIKVGSRQVSSTPSMHSRVGSQKIQGNYHGPPSGLVGIPVPLQANVRYPNNPRQISISEGSGKENSSPKLPQTRRSPCNCKKTKCLKLYCECFAALLYCDGCNCQDCNNTPAFEAVRSKAIKDTKAKNPNAFKPRISVKPAGQSQMKGHNMGCRCKKSACLKKYCECFQNGVTCSIKCKCVDCQNYVGSQALIDRRRKIKDHVGAEMAMRSADEYWKGKAPAKNVPMPTHGLFPSPAPPRIAHHPMGMHPMMSPPSSHGQHYMGPPMMMSHMGYSPIGMQPATPLYTSNNMSRNVNPPKHPRMQKPSQHRGPPISTPRRPVARRIFYFKPNKRRSEEMKRRYFGLNNLEHSKTTALTIFSFLSNDDIYNASLVSRTWSKLSLDETIWDFNPRN